MNRTPPVAAPGPPAARIGSILMLLVLLHAPPARATATAYAFQGGEAVNHGLATVAIVDHAARRVRVVTSLRVEGAGASFAVLVPTPARPTIRPVDRKLWTELLSMTRPLQRQRGEDGSPLACSNTVEMPVAPYYSMGLDLVAQASQFLELAADTTFTGSNVIPMLVWLYGRGFNLPEEEAQNLRALAERGWWITILSPTRTVPLSGYGWDVATEPLLFEYEADSLEVPTAMLRGARHHVRLSLVMIDRHRMAWPGGSAQTWYANRLSPEEVVAARRLYPTVGGFVAPGDFVTRLDLYAGGESTTVTPTAAPNDSEFRQLLGAGGGYVPLESLLLLSAPALAGRINRRRSRRERS